MSDSKEQSTTNTISLRQPELSTFGYNQRRRFAQTLTMKEIPGDVLDRVRRGEMQLDGSQESQNGEVPLRKAVGNDMSSDAGLDRMQRGESSETTEDEENDIKNVESPFMHPSTCVDENLKALDNIWNKKAVISNKKGRLDVIHKTRELLTNSVAELIQDGKTAHHQWARVQQELDLANEYISSKSHEIERLRALDAKNRENISVSINNNLSTFFGIEFSTKRSL